jgi:putative ABC transport system substrate-binding protein
MRRRHALGVLGLAGVAAVLRPLSALAQGAARRPIVGSLQGATRASNARLVDAFLQGMKEFGYVEGQNVTIEWRFAEGFTDRLPGLAQELVRLGPDVLLVGTAGLAAARQATATIPIVVPNLGFAQTTVVNLARPEGNVTGIRSADIGNRQRFELVAEVIPGAAKVGYLLSVAGADGGAATKQRAEAAASAARIKLAFAEYRSPDDIGAAFQALVRERVDAVVAVGTVLNVARQSIVALAARERMPTIYDGRDAVAAGGLAAVGPDTGGAAFRRAAYYVDKIIKGAKPADLPVEQPNTLVLVVNLTTAKAIGLTFPASVLARATEVIQ